MEYIILSIVVFVCMIAEGASLVHISIKQLVKRYQEKTENDIAFELLSRYSQASIPEQGEIIWGLLAPHQTDLSKIVARMGEDPGEELQKLFIKLHQLFLKGKFPHSNWKFWLARILKNDLLNLKNRQKPYTYLPLETLQETGIEEEPEEPVSMNQMTHAIDKLSEKQKQVIELRYLKRGEKLLTYKEIAKLMNCSVGQVHGYLDRAKENLRTQLNEAAN